MAKGLGKGLGALFGVNDNNPQEKKTAKVKVSNSIKKEKNIIKNKKNTEKENKLEKNTKKTETEEYYTNVPIMQVNPNPNQPRKSFSEDSLKELAESIKNSGIIQPLIVSPHPNAIEDSYIIVAGERRYRASQLAGLKEIPVIIRKLDEKTLLKQALIENIQRENLNVLEEAIALQALKDEHGMTQEELAESTGKSRSNIAQVLRLLSLPKDIQNLISSNQITLGHARPIIGLGEVEQQLLLAKEIVEKSLSVRQTEQKAQQLQKKFEKLILEKEISNTEEEIEEKIKQEKLKLQIENIENKLTQLFKTKVSILPKKKGGEIRFYYYSDEELENLFENWDIQL